MNTAVIRVNRSIPNLMDAKLGTADPAMLGVHIGSKFFSLSNLFLKKGWPGKKSRKYVLLPLGFSGEYPLKYLVGPHLHKSVEYRQALKKLTQALVQVGNVSSVVGSHRGKFR